MKKTSEIHKHVLVRPSAVFLFDSYIMQVLT